MKWKFEHEVVVSDLVEALIERLGEQVVEYPPVELLRISLRDQFNKKVDNKHIMDTITAAGSNPDYKKLSKEIITGKEVNMTCFLTDSENQLGRSVVIDLSADPKSNFRQIDHRTVNSIILKNVKYTVK